MSNETNPSTEPDPSGGRVPCFTCGTLATPKKLRKGQSPLRDVFCSRKCYYERPKGRTYRRRSDAGAERSEYGDFVCSHCGSEFRKLASAVKDPNYAFCSLDCYQSRGGDIPVNKRGGRPLDSGWTGEILPDLPEVHAAIEKYGPPLAALKDVRPTTTYLIFRWPSHPLAKGNHRVPCHRVVAFEYEPERLLNGGRSIHVDHINNDGLDNRWENLQVMTVGDHARKTAKMDRSPAGLWHWAKKTHPEIIEEFERI